MPSYERQEIATCGETPLDREIADILRCPRCRGPLDAAPDLRCGACGSSMPSVDGTPVLVDFSDTILSRDALLASAGASTVPRRRGLLRGLREWAEGRNNEAAGNCALFLAELRRQPRRRVLVIGGGSRGSGTEALYAAGDIRVVGTDVYAAPDVEFIVDGHALPFADASFDGVWIQAVLEHVTTPARVVAEIHRVLADGGLVYAETPFLQPVHERAWDFTRFTRSGHRWLFRDFSEVRAGTIGGPGETAVWAMRYLGRALFRSEKAGAACAVAFVWLRWLDRFVDDRHRADSATGTYFLGRKAGPAMAQADLVGYFPGVR